MFVVVSVSGIALVRGSIYAWLGERALVKWPFWPNFRGKVVFSNHHVLVRIELRGANVELVPNLKMTFGF